jgi:hypothetical protein
MRPLRVSCRARRDWRASFDVSAACDIGRPLNFTVRQQRKAVPTLAPSLRFAGQLEPRNTLISDFPRCGTMRYDESKIDEAVLAVLYLTAFERNGATFAWKGIDWDATKRLFQGGFIDDPKTKAKSVLFTDEGLARAKAAADKLFAP